MTKLFVKLAVMTYAVVVMPCLCYMGQAKWALAASHTLQCVPAYVFSNYLCVQQLPTLMCMWCMIQANLYMRTLSAISLSDIC